MGGEDGEIPRTAINFLPEHCPIKTIEFDART